MPRTKVEEIGPASKETVQMLHNHCHLLTTSALRQFSDSILETLYCAGGWSNNHHLPTAFENETEKVPLHRVGYGALLAVHFEYLKKKKQKDYSY